MVPAPGMLIALLLLGLAPVCASAQVPVVGYLRLGSPEPVGPPFVPHLKGFGHQEGRTFLLESRYARGDNSRFPALVGELLDHRPAVIFAPCGPALRAIRELSRSVPVVAGCADPKNFLGEVASLSRPGGRTTGFTFLAPESAGKRLQLLKELLPTLSRVGILHNRHSEWGTYLQEMERARRCLASHVRSIRSSMPTILKLPSPLQSGNALRRLSYFPDAITFGARQRIATLAINHKLPTAFDTRIFAVDGGLLDTAPIGPIPNQPAHHSHLHRQGSEGCGSRGLARPATDSARTRGQSPDRPYARPEHSDIAAHSRRRGAQVTVHERLPVQPRHAADGASRALDQSGCRRWWSSLLGVRETGGGPL